MPTYCATNERQCYCSCLRKKKKTQANFYLSSLKAVSGLLFRLVDCKAVVDSAKGNHFLWSCDTLFKDLNPILDKWPPKHLISNINVFLCNTECSSCVQVPSISGEDGGKVSHCATRAEKPPHLHPALQTWYWKHCVILSSQCEWFSSRPLFFPCPPLYPVYFTL